MIYCFEDIELDCARTVLRRAGREVAIEPKVFDFIHYMVEHPDRLVSKDELLDELWEGRIVGEAVITRCASEARKALGKPAKARIATVYGRGYRFNGPVKQVAQSASLNTAHEVSPAPLSSGPGCDLSTRGPKFVGRRQELERIRRHLIAARAGQGSIVWLTGEAGIGKTRLGEEVEAQALSLGLRTIWGRCSESDGAAAYWPFKQLVRGLLTTPALRAEASALLPELISSLRVVKTAASGADDRLLFFDRVDGFLQRAAANGPLLVILDDLHRADVPSLHLLAFLAARVRQAPMLVLGTFRETELRWQSEVSKLIVSSTRAADALTIPLTGLEPEAVDDLVRASLEGHDVDRMAVALHERTGGNPLFLTQLVSLLERNKEGSLDVSRLDLPASVRETILGQLRLISAGALSLVELAAVVGREFELALLAQASGMDYAEMIALLDEAVVAGIVTPVHEFPATSRFAHVLVRDQIYVSLSAKRRAELHLRIAETAERFYRDTREQRLAELAHHFAQGAPAGGGSKALGYATEAGALMLGNLAYESAAQHFSLALAILEAHSPEDRELKCAILLDLAAAQIRAAFREDARESLRRAAFIAREHNLMEVLVHVALGAAPGFFSIEVGVHDSFVVGLLEEVLALLSGSDPSVRAQVLARLALALYWSDQKQRIVELCEQAESLLDDRIPSTVMAQVRSWCLAAHFRPDNLEQRSRDSVQAIDAADRAGDRELLQVNNVLRMATLMQMGNFDGVRNQIEACRRTAEALNQPSSLWLVPAHRAMLAMLDGHLEEVEQLANQVFSIGGRVQDHSAILTFGVQIALVRLEQGLAGEVAPLIADYVQRYPAIPGWRALLAYAWLSDGKRDLGRTHYEQLAAEGFQFGADVTWLMATALAAEVASCLDDRERAPILFERLRPYADHIIPVGYGIVCWGSVQRYLGQLAACLGDWSRAEECFERALRQNAKIGARLLVAHTQRDYAQMLRARNAKGDEARSAELDRTATACALELGLKKLHSPLHI